MARLFRVQVSFFLVVLLLGCMFAPLNALNLDELEATAEDELLDASPEAVTDMERDVTILVRKLDTAVANIIREAEEDMIMSPEPSTEVLEGLTISVDDETM
ncbi:hypothetical protein BWQ96_09155 [Gracilariopsis chorda]|uniref:Transmembrane protein n=1 Tax=Gracilariopsis chorda TaxID=448386 RepID=A0A2V3IGH5_9FLOR|nr:hypothetical protein BWQ96_09155 [Gracilariopsis chorda]|eukprot:PXF41123.1 hypothetical protein BWQ96_09155 [Gracilariopsis chorda]